jgi:hypothetical protein
MPSLSTDGRSPSTLQVRGRRFEVRRIYVTAVGRPAHKSRSARELGDAAWRVALSTPPVSRLRRAENAAPQPSP